MNLKNRIFKITHWESWHYLAKYIPIMPVWLWHCFRSRSLWFFTPSNPTLTFGGFEGEPKKEMYDQLPPGIYPKSIYISPGIPSESLKKAVLENKFLYPFAVKPDTGMMGFMFRRIENEKELLTYHDKMPVDYIIQEMALYPMEVSVFYYRYPNEKKGVISGFLKKELIHVKGDGKSTLEELLHMDEKLRFRIEEMKIKHGDNMDRILPPDEIYMLSYALNLSRGGRFISLAHEIDEQLLKVFDELSHHAKHFYYGRYDIKCASVQSLKEGKDFTILEYNGCGAEPHHAYGNGKTLLQAYGIFLHHWKVLYKISKYNHEHGFPHWSFRRGWKYLKAGKAHYRLIKKLDAETQL